MWSSVRNIISSRLYLGRNQIPQNNKKNSSTHLEVKKLNIRILKQTLGAVPTVSNNIATEIRMSIENQEFT
jgi:hypothetical protein